MPIYEYKCDACEYEFEKIQKMSDEPIKVCPQCHAEAVRKLISASGFRLKGGGWYETDFKTGNKRNVVDSADKKTAGSKSEGSSKKADTPASAKPSGSDKKTAK